MASQGPQIQGCRVGGAQRVRVVLRPGSRPAGAGSRCRSRGRRRLRRPRAAPVPGCAPSGWCPGGRFPAPCDGARRPPPAAESSARRRLRPTGPSPGCARRPESADRRARPVPPPVQHVFVERRRLGVVAEVETRLRQVPGRVQHVVRVGPEQRTPAVESVGGQRARRGGVGTDDQMPDRGQDQLPARGVVLGRHVQGEHVRQQRRVLGPRLWRPGIAAWRASQNPPRPSFGQRPAVRLLLAAAYEGLEQPVRQERPVDHRNQPTASDRGHGVRERERIAGEPQRGRRTTAPASANKPTGTGAAATTDNAVRTRHRLRGRRVHLVQAHRPCRRQ